MTPLEVDGYLDRLILWRSKPQFWERTKLRASM